MSKSLSALASYAEDSSPEPEREHDEQEDRQNSPQQGPSASTSDVSKIPAIAAYSDEDEEMPQAPLRQQLRSKFATTTTTTPTKAAATTTTTTPTKTATPPTTISTPPSSLRTDVAIIRKAKQPRVESPRQIADAQQQQQQQQQEQQHYADQEEDQTRTTTTDNINNNDEYTESEQRCELEDDESLLDEIPPEPQTECNPALAEAIAKRIETKRREGLSLNENLKKRKEFSNPEILDTIVSQYQIDEIGSNYPLELWDPHKYKKEDFYDELANIQKAWAERKEAERRKREQIEFVPASGPLAAGAMQQQPHRPKIERVKGGQQRPTAATATTTTAPGSIPTPTAAATTTTAASSSLSQAQLAAMRINAQLQQRAAAAAATSNPYQSYAESQKQQQQQQRRYR